MYATKRLQRAGTVDIAKMNLCHIDDWYSRSVDLTVRGSLCSRGEACVTVCLALAVNMIMDRIHMVL